MLSGRAVYFLDSMDVGVFFGALGKNILNQSGVFRPTPKLLSHCVHMGVNIKIKILSTFKLFEIIISDRKIHKCIYGVLS